MVRGSSRDRARPWDRVPSAARLLVVVVLAVAVVVAGGVALGFFGSPSVSHVENRFAGVSAETTTIRTDVVVSNPNPIGLGSDDVAVAYTVELNGIEVADGRKEGVSIDADGSTVPFRTEMDNSVIPGWWVSHVRNGERSELVVHATVSAGVVDEEFEAPAVERTVETDLTSAFNSTETRAVNADREPLIDDPVLYVNETRGRWGAVTDEETTIRASFDVHNPKPYPIYVQQLRYDLAMNDVAVGEGATGESYLIRPGETRTVETSATIDNEKLDDWWVSHLRRNQRTELRVDLELVVDLSAMTGGDGPTITVPIGSLTRTVETDVFGNKDRYPTGDAGNATDGGA